MNYGGDDKAGILYYAHEFPLGLMNCQTDLSPSDWSSVKRYKLSNITVRLELAESFGGEIFLGWNKTPSGLDQKQNLTSAGFFEYQRRCDVLRVGGSANKVSLSLNLSVTGWRQYVSVPLYTKYKDLIDRELLRYCYGSLVIGFTVQGSSSKTLTKAEIGNLIQIRAVQTTQGSK